MTMITIISSSSSIVIYMVGIVVVIIMIIIIIIGIPKLYNMVYTSSWDANTDWFELEFIQ